MCVFRFSMSQLQGAYQDIQPVTFQLPEESATARLYCSNAEGMEARLSTFVEVFLVEIYRCRVCQFTSSVKARISTHVSERHDLGHPCHPLADDDEGDTLDVKVGVVEDDLDSCASPYDLDDELHSATKDRDEHTGLERLPFLLPVYGMLQNISPRLCDESLGPNTEVAHTCEVTTLFEEEEDGTTAEEAAHFHLVDSSTVEMPGPLSCSIDSVGPEDQDEEAQSAHLMSLGLYRISSIKCHAQSGTQDSRSASVHLGRDGSESTSEEKASNTEPSETVKSEEDAMTSCILRPEALPRQNSEDIQLKCYRREQGCTPPPPQQAVERRSETERPWSGHQQRTCGKSNRIRTAISRDFRRQRRCGRGPSPALCARCLTWCSSEREFDQHDRCHVRGGFKCLHCSFTDQAWDEVHKHILTEHEGVEDALADVGQQESDSVLPAPLHADRPGPPILQGQGQRKTERKRGRRSMKRGRRSQVEERKVRGLRHFCCPLCDRKFSAKLTLRRHMGVHQAEKPFSCPHCPYSSRLKASLVQHLRVHTGEKPFRCSQCPYASIDSSSLLRHSRTHTQEHPHRCQHCSYSSIQKKSLDLHVRRYHTGESFPCHLCCYTTPDRQLLHRHLRKHHASNTALPSFCPSRRRRPSPQPEITLSAPS